MSEKQIENNQQKTRTASNSRRKLVKGVAAAPLLMTVASRPVLAKGICTPSAWVSGNLSDHHKERECGGLSPGYWGTHPDKWPAGYNPGSCATTTTSSSGSYGSHKSYGGTYSSSSNDNKCCKVYKDDGTQFSDVFCGGYPGKTLMQVIWLTGTDDKYQLGAHIVAALFNAITIPDYGMSEQDVIDLYCKNSFDMTSDEMVEFITQTFSESSTYY